LIFDALLAGFNFDLLFSLATLFQLSFAFEPSFFFGVEFRDLLLFALLLFNFDVFFYFLKEFLPINRVSQTSLALYIFRWYFWNLGGTSTGLAAHCHLGGESDTGWIFRLK